MSEEELGVELNEELVVKSLLEILTKRRSQSFYKPIDIHSVTNAIKRDCFFKKHVEHYESVR